MRGDCAHRTPTWQILLPNSFAAAWLVKRAAIPDRWGYAADMRASLLNTRWYHDRRAVCTRGLLPIPDTHAWFDERPARAGACRADRSDGRCHRQLRDAGWDGVRPLVVFAPGAAYGTAKRWMPEYVARVVTDLVRQHQATCVLVGSAGDSPTTRGIRTMIEPDAAAHVIDLSGQTTLEILAGILGLARACVTNDSGRCTWLPPWARRSWRFLARRASTKRLRAFDRGGRQTC
jgi:heptosyltransferase-2